MDQAGQENKIANNIVDESYKIGLATMFRVKTILVKVFADSHRERSSSGGYFNGGIQFG